MTSPPSRLTDRDRFIVQTVTRFRMVSASQVRRLHFQEGTSASRAVKQRRSLARLTRWGVLRRIQRPVGGAGGGSGGYIYTPTTSRATVPDGHTLDITELYVRLTESKAALLTFDPEPYCHVQLGHLELKPDAFIRIKTKTGTYRYFIELDRGTEWRSQIAAKMRRFNQAYDRWPEPTFPKVLFLVPDPDRLRFVEGVAKRQENPGHFETVLVSDAVSRLTQ